MYNILHDYTCCFVTVGKNRIGCNADPSNKTVYNPNGQLNRFAGFPLGCTSDSAACGHIDKDDYTIRTWLGLLGPNASTTIIDTSLYGKSDIAVV